MDRFFAVLPFNSRVPRNQFFAELAGRIARICLSSWSSRLHSGPRSGDCGVFDPRFELHMLKLQAMQSPVGLGCQPKDVHQNGLR